MRKQDKKILLFLIATMVTSFGIGYNLFKKTYAFLGDETKNIISSYNITYLSNWPLSEMGEQTKLYDASNEYVILENFFTIPNGYVFDGWNTERNGNGIKYIENDIIENVKSNMTLYAQWKLLNEGLY